VLQGQSQQGGNTLTPLLLLVHNGGSAGCLLTDASNTHMLAYIIIQNLHVVAARSGHICCAVQASLLSH
jgi:hypothetical protein